MNAQQRHAKVSEIFLSALEYQARERAEFLSKACGKDTELLAEIENMLAAHEQSNVFLDKPLSDQPLTIPDLLASNTPNQPLIGQKFGKYCLVREIGQGGMGTVYQAIREDLPKGKPVAVKILKPGINTEAIFARFRVEYQIMANLEHPSIARLLDGGTDNSLPYFVMEMVNGQPIDEYCKTKQLTIREKIELFIKVCSAVQFAHLNLIVHRDLKPSNILITSDGDVKLLDFGIAKIIKNDGLYEDIKLTQTGLRVMTPAYASPEQVLGEKITVAIDIYALGVLLYELLTSHLPYEFKSNSPRDIEKVICEQIPVKPSVMAGRPKTLSSNSENTLLSSKYQKRLVKLLSGDLDNIVLMALRKEPERRYSSVEQFTQDLQRYLDNYPVLAQRDTLTYRISKFLKRNGIALTTVIFIILLFLAGTVSTIWQATRANQERAQVEAQKQLIAARSKDIRSLTNALLFKYNDQLEQLSGATALREEMLSEAIKYLDQLSQQSSLDIELQTELGLAYRRVGDIQGRPFRINVGNTSAALESYKKSLSIFEKLATINNSSKIQSELATALERVGENFSKIGNLTEAIRYYQTVVEIRRQVERNSGFDSENEYLLASCYIKIGDIWQLKADFINTLQFYCSALDIFKKLSENDPKNQKFRRGLAVVYTRLIVILESSSDLLVERISQAPIINELNQKSLYYSNLITENAKQALSLEPDNPFLQSELAGCYLLSGSTLLKVGDTNQALVLLQNALIILEKLISKDPSNTEYQFQLGLGYTRLGEAQLKLKEITNAISSSKKALSILELLSNRDPNNTIFKNYLAHTYNLLAIASISSKSSREAENNLRKSLVIWKDLSTRYTTNISFRLELLRSLNRLTEFLVKKGNIEEANKLAEEVLVSYKEKIKVNGITDVELSDYAWFLLNCKLKSLPDKNMALDYAEKANQINQGKNLPVLLTLLSIKSLSNTNQNEEFKFLEIQIKKAIGCSK